MKIFKMIRGFSLTLYSMDCSNFSVSCSIMIKFGELVEFDNFFLK